MDPKSDVHAGENRDLGGSGDARNDISGGIVAFNCLSEVNNFSDVLQSKCGHYGDLSASMISELVKLDKLESASSHTLFNVINRILEESIERKNGDITMRLGFVLKLLVQEMKHRVSKQADNTRKQISLYKSRENRYHTKLRALETIATGIGGENEVLMRQLQQTKADKTKLEEENKLEKQVLIKLRSEKDSCESRILSLNEELALAEKSYKEDMFQLETKAKETRENLQKKILELDHLLTDSNKKVKVLEDFTESKFMRWKRKEQGYKSFIDSQSESIQELRSASNSVKQEVTKIKKTCAEELYNFSLNIRGLVDAAQNYHSVLEENRKLYNEVQDLKGNVRVYCRIRPFLSGQSGKQTAIQYIGENGELVVINPSKPGKDSHRLFKFNKVFHPATTQEEVFQDTQQLIRSVLDGYNVCIFAYGQTGSGKTYTMTGPNMTSVADWGVNYRALNDLFSISQRRSGSITYEIGVQMVEIYNEQVRDLLCNDTFQKRLGIWNTSRPSGLAVPGASLHPVNSTADVLELMNVGLMNRAVGATALNERSSRSHSILTVHVRGVELETSAVLRGCLHLVDLAGSERVDRSEAKGDRLREAQNINKSLSALGDVIFALAQKSSHVPFRNSKLTQVLQSSLGGQAKTLMFVQLNPDVESYSETVSTLKFAERVSGVELGAARSNKEGRGVRELMELVSSLKEAVAKKDAEIEHLQSREPNRNSEKPTPKLPTNGSTSLRRHTIESSRPAQKLSRQKSASDLRNSDKGSEAGSRQSMDDFKHHKEFFRQSRLAAVGGEKFRKDLVSKLDVGNVGKDSKDDEDILGFGDGESDEKLSDISDVVLSMGTEDGSINSIVEYTLFPETAKPPPSEITEKRNLPVQFQRPPKQGQVGSSRPFLSKSSSKAPSLKKSTAGPSSSSAIKLPRKWPW